jgi:ubiquinone/menaquinone biosynthesis C-methylase UbiE
VEKALPAEVLGIDRSEGFIEHARASATGARLTFQVGDAQALPVSSGSFDAVVSGLVLNFVSEPERMVAEMARAGRPGSTIALYVWDYGAGMDLMRRLGMRPSRWTRRQLLWRKGSGFRPARRRFSRRYSR